MSAEVREVACCSWHHAGDDVFPAMLRAIDGAIHEVGLEVYIFSPGELADRFRATLVAAAKRGVKVRVLIDALGSANLSADYWQPLQAAGGEARHFNPLALRRLGIRNHRKLLVCDQRVAFVGGFNIAAEYEGDGLTKGWCDLGIEVEGSLARQLALSFEEMFARAEFRHKRFIRIRRTGARRQVDSEGERLLLSGPGWGWNPIKRSLRQDLVQARNVQIIAAYFLPTWRIRRDLVKIARRGGNVQIILPAKSDVEVSRLAAQSLYRRLLRSGIRIYEYQPQVLHAKLIIIDDAVYVGSANLDQRSLNINYELMVRLEGEEVRMKASQLFGERLKYCEEITRESWRRSRSLWARAKQRWAYWVLVRLDPLIARWQLRTLPD